MLVWAGGAAWAEPVPVEPVQTPDGGWQLMRGGQPYIIKGGGGDKSNDRLDDVVAAGGNSIRLWGVNAQTGDIQPTDKALKVTSVSLQGGPDVVDPGDLVEAWVVSRDPEGSSLFDVTWVLVESSQNHPQGGANAPPQPLEMEHDFW